MPDEDDDEDDAVDEDEADEDVDEDDEDDEDEDEADDEDEDVDKPLEPFDEPAAELDDVSSIPSGGVVVLSSRQPAMTVVMVAIGTMR